MQAETSDFYVTSNLTLAGYVMLKTGKEPNVDREPRGLRYYFDDADGEISWLVRFELDRDMVNVGQLLRAIDSIRRGAAAIFPRK